MTPAVSEETMALCARVTECLSARPAVRLAVLFGSRVTGRDRAKSDVDVAVLLEHNAIAACDPTDSQIELELALLPLLGGREVDVILLNMAPLGLRRRVSQTGLVLFQRAGGEWHWFRRWTLNQWRDRAPVLRRRWRHFHARLREVGLGRRRPDTERALEEARRVCRALAVKMASQLSRRTQTDPPITSRESATASATCLA